MARSQRSEMEIYTSMIDKFPELLDMVEEMPEVEFIRACGLVRSLTVSHFYLNSFASH